MRSGIFAIIKFARDGRGPDKLKAKFDDAVFRRHVRSDHRLMPGYLRLAILRRHIHPRLRAFERPIRQRKRRNDLAPVVAKFGALKIVGKKQLLLFGNRLSWHLRQIRRSRTHAQETQRRQWNS
jgi:hypothetical protein